MDGHDIKLPAEHETVTLFRFLPYTDPSGYILKQRVQIRPRQISASSLFIVK